MFTIKGNEKIEKILNNNAELIGKDIFEHWQDSVSDGGYLGSLKDFIEDCMFEYMSFEFEGEYIELDDYEYEVDEEKMYEESWNWS